MEEPKILKKVTLHDTLNYDAREEIGYIQLLEYLEESKFPQLEFHLNEEYRNKGIMTIELKKFLEAIKEEYPHIIAIVKEDNLASVRVLDKLGFVRFVILGDNHCYLTDLRQTKETVEAFVEYNLGLLDK
jgi:RimJ/RimL family protein N-acetyltransferase